MPREYCVWRPEEERALLTGVDRHGLGAWELIRTDPDLKSLLKYVAHPRRGRLPAVPEGFEEQLGLLARIRHRYLSRAQP